MTDEQIRQIVCPGSAQMSEIVASVAKVAAVPVAEIMGTSRLRKVARARQLAMWHGRQAGLSYPQIGQFLNRDHTSVMNGVRRVEQLMKGLK